MHIQNPYTHAQPHIPNPHCKWLAENLQTALNLHDEWGDLSILEHTNSSGAILYTDVGCFGGLGFLEASNPSAPSGKEKEPCFLFFPIENNAPIERICRCSTRAALHRTLTFSQWFQYGNSTFWFLEAHRFLSITLFCQSLLRFSIDAARLY